VACVPSRGSFGRWSSAAEPGLGGGAESGVGGWRAAREPRGSCAFKGFFPLLLKAFRVKSAALSSATGALPIKRATVAPGCRSPARHSSLAWDGNPPSQGFCSPKTCCSGSFWGGKRRISPPMLSFLCCWLPKAEDLLSAEAQPAPSTPRCPKPLARAFLPLLSSFPPPAPAALHSWEPAQHPSPGTCHSPIPPDVSQLNPPEPQIHSMAGAGGDLCGSSRPTSLPEKSTGVLHSFSKCADITSRRSFFFFSFFFWYAKPKTPR